MDPFKRSWAVCDAQVRSHLQSDERVLAVGRCADITEYGGPESGGTARTYVMVTDRRLRWIPSYRIEFEASLDLEDVTAFTEQMLAHRYAIAVQHAPLERRRISPDLEFPPELADRLRAEGRLRDSTGPFSYTELAFSHRGAAAARALREALVSRLGH